MTIERKSPLNAKPLRNPGQSLDEEIENILTEKVIIYFIAAGLAVSFAWLEWFRWFRPHKPSPVVITVLAVGVCFYCGFKIVQAKKKLKNKRLGRDGERAVGQYLNDHFCNSGARVFHDIPSNDFNIDHVIISENGVFVVETKTYSKPKRGQAIIKYSGESIKLDNGIEKADILIQVKAASAWLRELIQESTGRKFFFRPVVVFPGWYIEWTLKAKNAEVWVLNPKSLPGFVGNSDNRVSSEDVQLIAYHLSRYIRNFEGKK